MKFIPKRVNSSSGPDMKRSKKKMFRSSLTWWKIIRKKDFHLFPEIEIWFGISSLDGGGGGDTQYALTFETINCLRDLFSLFQYFSRNGRHIDKNWKIFEIHFPIKYSTWSIKWLNGCCWLAGNHDPEIQSDFGRWN